MSRGSWASRRWALFLGLIAATVASNPGSKLCAEDKQPQPIRTSQKVGNVEEVQTIPQKQPQQQGGKKVIIAPPQFLEGAPPFAGPVDTSKFAPGLDLSNFGNQRFTEIPGFGKVDQEVVVKSLWSLNPDMARVRLVDIQGRPLVGSKKFPVPAIVKYQMPDSESVYVDSQGCFAAFSSPDVEMNGCLLLLIQTATGHSFDGFVKPVAKQIVDLRLPTHFHPKATPLQKVPTHAVAGVVVDHEGRAIAGVHVSVPDAPELAVRTDAKGLFQIGHLRKHLKSMSNETEGVPVFFSKPGYERVTVMEYKIGARGYVIAMDNRTWVEGTVRGSDGKPVAGAQVRNYQFHQFEGPAFEEDEFRLPGMWQEVTTDAAGHFRIPCKPGKCELLVRKPGSGIARCVEKPLNHGDVRKVEIALQPGATFDSTLIDSVTKQPVPNVRLWSRLCPDLEGRSDAQGRIKLVDVIPDRYEFTFEAKEHNRWWSDAVAAKKAEQRGDDQSIWSETISELKVDLRSPSKPLKVTLEKGVRVQGRIVDPDGKPVPAAAIRVVNASNGTWMATICRTSPSRVLETTAGIDGKFEMLLATSGPLKFRLVADEFSEPQPNQKWATGLSPAIALQPGQVIAPIEIKLNRPTTLKGKVVDAKGKTLPNCLVVLTSADHIIGSQRYGNDGLRLETNAEGDFEAKMLRPAFYEVEAWHQGNPTKQKLALSGKEPVKIFEIRIDPALERVVRRGIEIAFPPVRVVPAE